MNHRYLEDVNAARDRASELSTNAHETIFKANDTLDDTEALLHERVEATEQLAELVTPLVDALDHLIGETSWDSDDEDEG